MISQDTIRSAWKYEILAVLVDDIKNSKFYEIQKLYDTVHITSSMLLEQLRRSSGALTGINEMVFCDIAYILVQEISENRELQDVFQTLYDARHPKSVQLYNELRKALPSGQSAVRDALSEAMNYVFSTGNKAEPKLALSRPLFRYFMYYVYSDREIMDLGIITDEIIFQDAKGWEDRYAGQNMVELNDNRMTFSDTDEPVFSSKMYEKLIRRTRDGIANYLHIKDNEIAEYIYREMDLHLRPEDASYAVNPGIPGICNMSSMHIMQSKQGSAAWFQTITGDKRIRRGALGYKPDVDELIRFYCRARIETDYQKKVNSKEEFLKTTLLRDCMSNNPAEDYQAICYLYNYDIMFRMFLFMRTKYYEDFSWEKLTGKSESIRHAEVLTELRNIINLKDNTIESLQNRISLLSEASRKQDNVISISGKQIQESLTKELEMKNEEIAQLKEKIKAQEEFLRLLEEQSTEPETEEEIDITSLYGKKYLFVGYVDDTIGKLKKEFPDSLYMNNDNYSLVNVQADAIVMLIKHMSHSMWYKIRSRKSLRDVPVVYCNGWSVESILNEMTEQTING